MANLKRPISSEHPLRIVAMGCKRFSQLLHQVSFPLPQGCTLTVVNALLQDALQEALRLEEAGKVDVFLSAGANGQLISQHVKLPVALVRTTGFDLLLALNQCGTDKNPVGVVTYKEPVPFLTSVSRHITVPFLERVYTYPEELDHILRKLRDQGVTHVIGSSLVLDWAERVGLNGVFIYSSDGVTRAMESAVQIGLARQKEMMRSAQLNTILNFAREGIIATDSQGVIQVYNPRAEEIIGTSRAKAIGSSAAEVIPGTRIHHILQSNEAEFNHLQTIRGNTILTNRVPMHDTDGVLRGCVVTFQDVDTISKAEAKIRKEHTARQFQARTHFEQILGRSDIMQAALAEARQYAASEASVLIQGETGTGKELFAQAIHLAGPRKRQPFVAVNCAALPPQLLESELFGHEEGAFTGAKRGGKIGLFELAHTGTIFLDEIGEIPTEIQARLLRVLQEKEVLRLGGEHLFPVDVRVIAATNRNLKAMIKTEKFRADLYYRLCVLRLSIPPLRQRATDIPLLLQAFLRELRPDMSAAAITTLSRHPALSAYPWPGNIRELRNAAERFAAICVDPETPCDQLVEAMLSSEPTHDHTEPLSPQLENPARKAYRRITPQQAEDALARCGGNRSAAAKLLGVDRSTLWRVLR